VAGLVLATGLAEVLGDAVIPSTVILTIAAALAFGLLADRDQGSEPAKREADEGETIRLYLSLITEADAA
jgi:hypothetical protein